MFTAFYNKKAFFICVFIFRFNKNNYFSISALKLKAELRK